MQKTLLIGNLGKDPELREVQGKPVCAFSMATTERWKDQQGNRQERTEWHRIVAWYELATTCARYLKKGSRIYIEGKNRTRKWTDQGGVERYVTEIVARKMEMLDTANSATSDGNQGNPPQSFSDDVPF